jgi:hypothetical protein
MDPLTVQYGPPLFPAAFQRGSLRVTAATGSPIAEFGMLLPSFEATQSASVIVFDTAGDCASNPNAQNVAAAPAAKIKLKHDRFICLTFLRHDTHCGIMKDSGNRGL